MVFDDTSYTVTIPEQDASVQKQKTRRKWSSSFFPGPLAPLWSLHMFRSLSRLSLSFSLSCFPPSSFYGAVPKGPMIDDDTLCIDVSYIFFCIPHPPDYCSGLGQL